MLDDILPVERMAWLDQQRGDIDAHRAIDDRIPFDQPVECIGQEGNACIATKHIPLKDNVVVDSALEL